MLSTNLFLVLLLILPCSIIADDSSSFKPQDLTYPPIASSDADADASQPVTDLELSPEVLLAESENNVANCQGPPPGGSTRRSRIRKRQNNFCSWQPFKSGAPTTTPPQTAPQNDVSGTEKGPADVQKPEGDKAPIVNPFGGAKTPEICGPEKETIPVCHYSPERLGSNRWLSPTPVLTPVRLCRFSFPPPPILPSLKIGFN